MSSYVTFPKEPAGDRDLPPPPVPPPVKRPVHGLPDRAASQGNSSANNLKREDTGILCKDALFNCSKHPCIILRSRLHHIILTFMHVGTKASSSVGGAFSVM